jgi:hypothetical protein
LALARYYQGPLTPAGYWVGCGLLLLLFIGGAIQSAKDSKPRTREIVAWVCLAVLVGYVTLAWIDLAGRLG